MEEEKKEVEYHYMAKQGHIAVEPIPPRTTEGTVKNGVLQPVTRSALVAVKVVFDGRGVEAGDIAYVRSNLDRTTAYGKEVFEIEGKRFIVIPEEEAIVVKVKSHFWVSY